MAEAKILDLSTGLRGSRVTPHNNDAEKSVLAAAMMRGDLVEEILAKVEPEEFYRPAHQKIFTAIRDLNQRGIPVDQLSVADRLEAEKQLTEVGGKAYLVEIASDALAIANWSAHADIVKRTYLLRELIRASTDITALGYDAPDDLDSVVEEAEKLIFNVTNRRVESNFVGINQLLTDAFKSIEELAARQDHLVGVPTGFKDLDAMLGGLRGGDFIVLAARPAVGNTSFALNIGTNAAKKGAAVALFSLEMSSTQLVQRVLCSEARVSLSSVRNGNVAPDDWGKIATAAGELGGLDLWVDDTPSISILEIRAKARRQLRNKEKGLIIVDYLQLMQPQGRRSENRQVEIAEISRGLKILAKELDMPVIALSQLSRAVESRKDKRPILSDLRESGAIEQDADIVMFIDRNTDSRDDDVEGRPGAGMAEIIIAKHRNGPTGQVDLVFLDRYTRFSDYASRA